MLKEIFSMGAFTFSFSLKGEILNRGHREKYNEKNLFRFTYLDLFTN